MTDYDRIYSGTKLIYSGYIRTADSACPYFNEDFIPLGRWRFNLFQTEVVNGMQSHYFHSIFLFSLSIFPYYFASILFNSKRFSLGMI